MQHHLIHDMQTSEKAMDDEKNGLKTAAPGKSGHDVASDNAVDDETSAAESSGETSQAGFARAKPAKRSVWSTPQGQTPDDEAGEPLSGEQLVSVIEALQSENEKLNDKLIRALADMDNLRKRTEREKLDSRKYAIGEFAKDLLNVGDSLQRALEALPEDTRDAEATLKSFAEGIEMTERSLLSVLERHGVVREDAKGQPFDPNKHEAVAKMADDIVSENCVLEVLQGGYLIGDRVLRPAKVVVSEGGPKLSPTQEAEADELHEAHATQPQAANDDDTVTLEEHDLAVEPKSSTEPNPNSSPDDDGSSSPFTPPR